MVDGVSGADMYRLLLDLGPERAPAVADEWVARQEPSTAQLTATAIRDLVVNPFRQIGVAARALRHPMHVVHDVVDVGTGVVRLGKSLRPTSETEISGEIGRRRRYIRARASLADVRDIRLEFGGTVNDVVLAAIAAGFRDLLIARGEEPQPHSVRSLVPVSVRPPGGESIRDNQVSLLLARLPVHLADPVARLAAVCEELAQLKQSKEAEAGAAVTSLARLEPFPLVSLPIRAAMRMAQHSVVTVTTNVSGPSVPLFGLGRRVLEIAPYVPIASTLRIGVAIFSYNGQLTFGITGDYESAPDIELLAQGIERSIAELVAAAHASGPREDLVMSGGRALFGYVGGDVRLRRQVFR
jgi:diacylglycerol O-acyltransferase